MADPSKPAWPPLRITAWAVAAAVAVAILGPPHVRALQPPSGEYTDFAQEWLSARNYFSGTPIYQDLPTSVRQHMSPPRRQANPMGAITYNAHPPFAVFVALPFAWLDYPHAHLAWNLVTFGLFLAAVTAVVRELGIPFRWPSVFPAVILLLSAPNFFQLFEGQLNYLLAALVTGAWAADRRGRSALSGVAVGLAGAVKLFPLFLLVYFVLARRRTGLVAAVLTFLAANALAGAVFGTGAYRDYAEAMPAITRHFQAAEANLSLTGFWMRLCEYERTRGWVGPTLGRVLAGCASLVVIGLVARACRRAAAPGERDRAFALTVVGMLLVSPITWPHAVLILLVPLGVVWMRVTAGPDWWIMLVTFILLGLHPYAVARLVMGGEKWAAAQQGTVAVTTAENLVLISVQHYALVSLFLLVLRLPAVPDVPARVADEPPERR